MTRAGRTPRPLAASPPRGGFTLVELLVAMAVIIALAAIALIVVPNILDQDRTTDGASTVRQSLMIAKARAARDGLPRGLRLVVGLDPNNPAKKFPTWVTELQYTEIPPILVVTPHGPMVSGPPAAPPVIAYPRVQFTYTTAGSPPWPAGAVGAIAGATPGAPARSCVIQNLTAEQAAQVVVDGFLVLGELGTVHRIVANSTNPGPSVSLQSTLSPLPWLDPTKFSVTVSLDHYPDTPLGAVGGAPGTTTPVYATHLFGLYGASRPLLGEATVQLPRNICVDITPLMLEAPPSPVPHFEPPSFPPGAPPADYDIVFSPTGQVLTGLSAGGAGVSQYFLWVRDYTKGDHPLRVTSVPPTGPKTYDLSPFQRGGEQQIVTIKAKSGALGVFPVMWPPAGGVYPAGQDPYYFARVGTAGS